MAQLNSLVLSHSDYALDLVTDPRRPMWHRVFQPQYTTQTLKRLILPTTLEPWLAKLVQQHTPRYGARTQ